MAGHFIEMLPEFLRNNERILTSFLSFCLNGKIQNNILDLFLSRLGKNYFPILAYHRIIDDKKNHGKSRFYYDGTVSCTFKEFESHVNLLERYFKIVPLATIAHHISTKTIPENDKPLAAMTFDDGYKSLLDDVLPLLAKERIPATLFLTAGILKKNSIPFFLQIETLINNDDFTENLAKKLNLLNIKNKSLLKKKLVSTITAMGKEERMDLTKSILSVNELSEYIDHNFLSPEDVRNIDCSLIEIGSHSYSHEDFSRLDTKSIQNELTSSKEYLENLTGKEVVSFALPFGGKKYFERVSSKTFISSGYQNICSTIFGLNSFTDSRFRLKRIVANEFDSLATLKLKLGGGLGKIAKLING